MGISSIRCRRWFSEFPTTPLPQPVAKNHHCCYLNIFQSPSSLFLYSSFFTETKSSCLGWVTYLWGCHTPLTLLSKGCGSCLTNRHTLLSVESKSLNVVVRLSSVRMTTGSQSRLRSGGVDRPLLPALSDCLAATDCCFWLRLAPPLTGGCEDSPVTSSSHQLSTTAFTWKRNQIRKQYFCP